MPFKYTLCLLLVWLCANTVFAQKQNVYFLKNSGKYVDSKDNADYIRIVSEPDSGTTFYNLKEYYKDGKAKFIGKTSRIEPPMLEEQCIEFFSSGKRKELANYKKGSRTGKVYDYYPNGKLYVVKQYSDTKKSQYDSMDGDYTILACNDSTGKALVADGNGYYVGFDDNFKYIEEEGNLKAGLKDGDWKGQDINKNFKLTFTEKYDNGKLLGGQAADNEGHQYNYTKRQIEPEFTGGLNALYSYLGSNIKYPVEAKKRNIQGKVILKFIVEKDGNIADIEVLKTPSTDLANEAIRVLKKTPKWIPGTRNGRPVRVLYTLPINFSLGEG